MSRACCIKSSSFCHQAISSLAVPACSRILQMSALSLSFISICSQFERISRFIRWIRIANMTSTVLRVRFGLPAHRIRFCQCMRLETALRSARINPYCDHCFRDWLLEMAVSIILLFSSDTNSITSVLDSSLMERIKGTAEEFKEA